ncbi:hypothetical protein [Nocardioides jejuensis]|uniref:Uncharacterized protein n=1 Tax=Nocardioides jejuensis TaxID=2502782 RepID=A0A4R1BVY0_9ACTN|nr:hypothetical protein [Nocardioides jejuensis]TCJ21647.1 hypothetical protein EPD65_14565 [Nocardioides jejuensis]
MSTTHTLVTSDDAAVLLRTLTPIAYCDCPHDHDSELPVRNDGSRPCPQPASWRARVRVAVDVEGSIPRRCDEVWLLCSECLDSWLDEDPDWVEVKVLARLNRPGAL